MTNRIRLARILGIDVYLDYTWFIIGILIAWTFTDVYGDLAPALSARSHLVMGILSAVLFFASVLGHELSHAVVAQSKKIPVDSITLFIFGGVARIKRDASSPKDEFLIAIVGPLSSVVFGALFLAIGWGSERAGLLAPAVIFQVLGLINFALAIFNMLPGFPLDGGRVLRAAAWRITGDVLKATRIASLAGRGLAGILILFGLYRIFFVDQLFGGVWLILIALFLYQAAVGGYRQLASRRSLTGLKVSDLMTPDPVTVPGGIRLDEAVDRHFLSGRATAYPVVGYADQVEGLLTIEMVNETPKESWPELTVRQVMAPLDPEITTSVQEPVTSLMSRIEANPTGRFVVLDGQRLQGMLSVDQILRRMRLLQMLSEEAGG